MVAAPFGCMLRQCRQHAGKPGWFLKAPYTAAQQNRPATCYMLLQHIMCGSVRAMCSVLCMQHGDWVMQTKQLCGDWWPDSSLRSSTAGGAATRLPCDSCHAAHSSAQQGTMRAPAAAVAVMFSAVLIILKMLHFLCCAKGHLRWLGISSFLKVHLLLWKKLATDGSSDKWLTCSVRAPAGWTWCSCCFCTHYQPIDPSAYQLHDHLFHHHHAFDAVLKPHLYRKGSR